MNNGFGHEVPPRHEQKTHREISRWLVVIPSADGSLARLFSVDHTQVGEFDAGTEEVMELIKTASASTGASGQEWDRALAGHSDQERASATVYTLDI
ncbi:MAG: hypothetical protein EOP35_24110 [Rubrivivax sp.]|nr:MAG: hypothetical protein EOP35_24110 [Rubrivivax sp.]